MGLCATTLGLCGHQIRMRRGTVRSMHRTPQRNSCAFMLDSCIGCRAEQGNDHRRAAGKGRIHPVQLAWMKWMYHSVVIAGGGADHVGGGITGEEAQTYRRRDRHRDERQSCADAAHIPSYTRGHRISIQAKIKQTWKHPQRLKPRDATL